MCKAINSNVRKSFSEKNKAAWKAQAASDRVMTDAQLAALQDGVPFGQSDVPHASLAHMAVLASRGVRRSGCD